MLLSRFWYIFLAVAAGAGAGAGLLGQGILNQQRDDQLADSLRRDRFAVEAVLRLEARNRLDRIAFITVDQAFGNLLRQAGSARDERRLREIGGQVKELMRGHYKRLVEAAGEEHRAQLEPDIAFAIDRQGRVVAQLGPMEANPPGASLATYPLVRRALQGYLRDDVWVYDRRVYRMAARPVVSGSEYAGAILHGYRFNNALAQQLATNLDGASIAFFHGTRMLGNHAPEDTPSGAELVATLPEILKNKDFGAGRRTEPIDLSGGGRATYSLTAGSAAQANVGYAIGRPRHLITSPMAMFEAASQQDLDRLPLVPLMGGSVLAAILGLLFVWLERDRPFGRLAKKTRDVADGQRERLIITEWRGRYRRMADHINHALDKTAELARQSAPSTKKKANLDEILGPTPDDPAEPFFGFATGNQPASREEPTVVPGNSRDAAPPPPARIAAAPAPSLKAPQATPAISLKPAVVPASTPSMNAAPLLSLAPDEDEEQADEEGHFRQVFQDYVAMRKECGESTEALTFEKFGVTLRKTRDQIIAKHGAKSVRFTVYSKQGKAALKASPVKG